MIPIPIPAKNGIITSLGETDSEEKETPDDSAAQSSVDVSDADDEGDDGSGKGDDGDDDVDGEEDKRSNLKTLVSGEDDKFYDAIEMAETFQVSLKVLYVVSKFTEATNNPNFTLTLNKIK